MKIAYTVCSLNRIGQVLTLGNSLLRYNPDYTFVVGLADEINGRINTADYAPFEFVALSELHLPEQQELVAQYDIFELSCALKAYYGIYLMERYNPEIVLYFDTDICIYHSLEVVENAFRNASVLITPHFTTPVPDDGRFPLERDVLNSGLYNGGFIGFKNDAHTTAFLQWWRTRLRTQGFNNVCEGMMVDQLWLNLAPLYFKRVHLLDHPGCNLAYWNMHERTLSRQNGTYLVNGMSLIFFHFSGFKPSSPNNISIHQNRHNIHQNEAIKNIIHEYGQDLQANGYEQHLSIPCVYAAAKPVKKHPFLKRLLIKALLSVGYKLEKVRKM